MIVFRKAAPLQAAIKLAREAGHTIGFVPTMGALHQGHMALIKTARETGFTVCSIFVNPAQFNDASDYNKYPITIEQDTALLEQSGIDAVFMPGVQEIYPEGAQNLEQYDLGYLETVLEGKYRPGHFQGVCQVMWRLLSIVQPDLLFMGQKDYQQCMVVKKLLELTGLHRSVDLQVCDTVREHDGLAMSSRNLRLKPTAREKATAISAALQMVKEQLKPGDLFALTLAARQMLTDKKFKVDYFEIADASTLQAVNEWDGRQKLVALTAAFLDDVRLIDNMTLN